MAEIEIEIPLPGDATVEIEVALPEHDAGARPAGHGFSDLGEPDGPLPPIRVTIRRFDIIYTRKFLAGEDGVAIPVPGYRQFSLEQGLLPNSGERYELERRLLALRTRVLVDQSGREDWANFALQAGTDETDGVGLFVVFPSRDTPERRQYAVIGHTYWWQREIEPAAREAALIAERDAGEIAADVLEPRIEAAHRHRNEQWQLSIERIHKTGTLEATLVPGRYAIAWHSDFHFNDCDPTDTAKYVITDRTGGGAVSVPVNPYALAVGGGQACRVDIWLTPRIHSLLVSWIDVYEWGSLFSSGFIFIANQRRWRDTLPWEPQPYRSTAIGVTGNDAAMSAFIQTRQNYAGMIRQRSALNVQGALFHLLHQFSINGQWRWFTSTYYAGDLAGIIRVALISRGQDVGGVESFVYHAVDEHTTPVEFDAGRLDTQEVSGDFGFLVSRIGLH